MFGTTNHSTPRTSARRWSAGVVAVATLVAAGCSDDSSTDQGEVAAGDEQEDALPNPGSDSFSEGDFDAIPIARGATEASERTEREGAISQSYTVTATSPEQIMEFYSTELPALGWEVVEPVRETGTDSYAAAWVQGSDRLEISALLAQGVDEERSQFSVVLLPDRIAGEDLNDPPTEDDADIGDTGIGTDIDDDGDTDVDDEDVTGGGDDDGVGVDGDVGDESESIGG